MIDRPTRAERLDHAVDAVLAGSPAASAAALAGLAPSDAPLVRAAAAVHGALAEPLVSSRFEARVGARLSGATAAPWILRHPGILVTGAVGSAAVGVGVTAFAVWRSTRRRPAGRLLKR
jgi:hypothetical protein